MSSTCVELNAVIYLQVTCSVIMIVYALVVIIVWGDVALTRVKRWLK